LSLRDLYLRTADFTVWPHGTSARGPQPNEGQAAVVVTDRREITFESRVVLEAIACNAKLARQLGLPSGTPTEVQFNASQNRVDITYEGRTLHTLSICAEDLAAFLIAYCTRIGVPLPRNADKSIHICETHVQLTVLAHINPLLTAALWPRRNGSAHAPAERIEATKAGQSR
jgi:hypothetical protein